MLTQKWFLRTLRSQNKYRMSSAAMGGPIATMCADSYLGSYQTTAAQQSIRSDGSVVTVSFHSPDVAVNSESTVF